MAGYLNEKEERKAAEVRKLIREANILKRKTEIRWNNGNNFDELAGEYYKIKDKADKLSLELVDYLRKNYPKNFLTHEVILSQEYIEYINNNSDDEFDKNMLKLITKYNNLLPIHDILFLTNGDDTNFYVLFNNNGTPAFRIWMSFDMLMPQEFYIFMEEMGLTITAVNKLYPLPTPLKIIANPGLWPNVVKSNYKLI